MDIICTRPRCSHPQNSDPSLDNLANLKKIQQKYCNSCGMPLILADRYLPIKLLGEGGFGRAFLARDRHTPTMRYCVVKQFQPSGNLTPQQLELALDLFEREAMVLEKLGSKNPQIPDLYAFFPLAVPNYPNGGEQQYFYLAQEYIEGENLELELERRRIFSEAEILELLAQILPVLQFVHDNGSIHRDIKPSNIIRSPENIFYLIDFGSVKQITANIGHNQLSTGIYSMGFAPPEQTSGLQVYPATDLYALAATCVNLLTNKATAELFNAYENRWNWRQYAPQISNLLAKTLDRMLLSSPSSRFQSAKEVINYLLAPPSPSPIPSPSPTSSLPSPSPLTPSPSPRPRVLSRPLPEILVNAAFTGFEAALFYIALASLLGISGVSLGLWGVLVGLFIFAQNRRIIEKIDLAILSGISLALVWFIPALRTVLGTNPPYLILVSGVILGLVATIVTIIFRLIYLLLSRYF
jgi:serine/threonine protein kinase